jgi:nucleoside-diphosphate-sugar epimerase
LYSKKKILIAGASGNIGSFLFHQLKSQFKTIGLSNNSSNQDYISIDLLNKSKIDNLIKDIEPFSILIFLVGRAHKKGNQRDIELYYQNNYNTLINLMLFIKKYDKIPDKIIFGSTISVYGERMHQEIYLEKTELKPLSPYAITKIEAEQYLLHNFNTRTWILRFSPVYAANFLLNIEKRTKIGNYYFKVGDGGKKISLCNINNIGQSIEGILKNKVPPGIYNISDENEYSYNDLLKYIDAEKVFEIPYSLVKIIYFLGKIAKNIYLKENSIKLLSNNLFPSNKIRKYLNLNSDLNRVQNDD